MASKKYLVGGFHEGLNQKRFLTSSPHCSLQKNETSTSVYEFSTAGFFTLSVVRSPPVVSGFLGIEANLDKPT